MVALRKHHNPNLESSEGRSSLRALLVRDFRRVEDEQEESAARERIRSLDHVPAFLLGVHLICAAAMVLAYGNPLGAPPDLLAPLGAAVALDVGIWAWLFRRPLSRRAREEAEETGPER